MATCSSDDFDEAVRSIFTLAPKQPCDVKSGQLSPEQVKQFFELGFVVIEDFFTKEELDHCKDAIDKLVDDLAQKLHKAGKINDLHTGRGFYERMTSLEQDFPGVNVILHKSQILPPAFRALWSNDRLLNVVEQLIGPDITGHPVWNLRCKTPRNEATTVPWHQDAGYLDKDAGTVLQPTAWIPLLNADEKNGCMEMASRGHRTGRVARHTCCWADTWYIKLPEAEMEKTLGVDLKRDLKVCPVPYGGMMLLNNMIPHRSLPNMSNKIRWSLDFRWQVPSRPVGFYGLKEGLLMRDSKNPSHTINWDHFHSGDRNIAATHEEVNDEDAFETTIQGPWMLKWEMTHQNRHTAKLGGKSFTSWH